MINDSSLIQSDSSSTRTLLKGIWLHLSRRRRLQLYFLLVLMLISGAAEMVSLGAVLPFLTVLSDPNLLWQNSLVQLIAIRVGFTQAIQLMLPATLIFALAAVLAALVRMANLWLSTRLSAAVGSDLSCEAYRRTLYQPYEVHIQRNSAQVITDTTTLVNRAVIALNCFLQLMTAAVVAAFLLFGLLLIDSVIALTAVVLFGGIYTFLAVRARRELSRNSQGIVEASRQQTKALQEGLGAIREVLLDNCQPMYVNIYRQADRPQRQLLARNQFLSSFPRYALESLGLVGIAILGGLLVLQKGSGAAAIPLLGSLALGAQRLLPAMQQIYRFWATLKGYNADLKGVLDMLNQSIPLPVFPQEPLKLRESLVIKSVCFSYGADRPEVLQGLDFKICKGERIGLVGGTGSGKTTTVDLIMGLLTPTSGQLILDGSDLHDPKFPERLSSWRSTIAHVPQNIYLADCSIAENIAFGVPSDKIDLSRIRMAAKQAQILEFIESLPDGFNTFVGERGALLSGGQRQRIGIARALYKNSNLLILDEATSALDKCTEKDVIESLEGISRELTLVMIAHRLSTLKLCDRVIQLHGGRIAAQGTPDQMLAKFI